MKASVEIIPNNSVNIRTHNEGGYGSDWQWGCVASPKEPGSSVAWITMVLTSPTREQKRAMERALSELGYTHYQWERRKNGERRVTREFGLGEPQ